MSPFEGHGTSALGRRVDCEWFEGHFVVCHDVMKKITIFWIECGVVFVFLMIL